ncbi:putative arabinose-binding protein precursor [compost metagenome]
MKFLAFSKLTKQANIELWRQLGFDPIRMEVWEAPELKEANKFTDYFGKDIFQVLTAIKNELGPVNVTEKMPAVIDEVKRNVMFKTLNDMEDPAKVLKESASQLRK